MQSLLLALSLAGLSTAHEIVQKRGGQKPSAMDLWYEAYNDALCRYTLLSLGCAAAAYYVWSLAFRFSHHLRRLATFSDDKQKYFVPAHDKFCWLKEHLIYAPLFGTRHNREFQLSSAIKWATCPADSMASWSLVLLP